MGQGRDPVRDPLELLTMYGATLERANGHLTYRLGARHVTLPTTPSDWRSDRNQIARIRKVIREQGLTPVTRTVDAAGMRPEEADQLAPVEGPAPLFFEPAPAPAPPAPAPAPPAPPRPAPRYAPCPLCPGKLARGRHAWFHRQRGEEIVPPRAVRRAAPRLQQLTMPLVVGGLTRLMKDRIEALPPIPGDLALALVPILVLAADQETELRLLRERHAALQTHFATLRAMFQHEEKSQVIERMHR